MSDDVVVITDPDITIISVGEQGPQGTPGTNGAGSGTVTSVSVTTANGVSGSVATATTTPAISLTLSAITPTSVNGVVISGSTTPTLAVTGTTTVSGTNTGDQTSVSGNAGTVTVGDAADDTTTWPLLGTAQTGSLSPATDAGLTYNAATATLTTTTFVGALTGNASSASAVAVGGITGLGTGVATALAINVGSAGAPVVLNGAGGTPSSMVGTNITGTASGLTAGTVTTNANLTGPITSVGNATSIASQTGTGTTFVMSAGPTMTGTTTIATGQVTGNLTVDGDLLVSGSTTTFNTATVSVEDPLIKFANGNTADVVDTGYYALYQPVATPLYTGLFRDATDGIYKLFDSLQVEPGTTVNTAGAGYNPAPLTLGALVASSVNGNTITAGTGTLTIGAGKTLTASNTITFTATDGSTLAIGTGGTLGTAAYTAATAYEVPLTFSTGLTRSVNTVSVNTSQNIATLSNLTSNGLVKTSGGVGTLGVAAMGTGIETFLATPSSANLAAALTDETGTGNAVFSASPTLTGTVIAAAITASGAFTNTAAAPQVTLGANAATLGAVKLFGNTSGDATVQPAAVAGTATVVTLPNASSTLPIFGQQITFTGPTAARSIALPDANFTVARTDAANTFTGVQTLSSQPILSSLTASQAVFTDASKGLVSNAITGSGSVVMSASPTLTGTLTAADIALSGSILLNNNKNYFMKDSGGTQRSLFNFDALNDLYIGPSAGGNAVYVFANGSVGLSISSALAVSMPGTAINMTTSGTTLTVGVGADNGTVSAGVFTDRTKHFDGDALAELSAIKGVNGHIDHNSLPAFARARVRKDVIADVEKEVDGKLVVSKEKVGEEFAVERDLGAMISMLVVAVQQIGSRLDKLEKK